MESTPTPPAAPPPVKFASIVKVLIDDQTVLTIWPAGSQVRVEAHDKSGKPQEVDIVRVPRKRGRPRR